MRLFLLRSMLVFLLLCMVLAIPSVDAGLAQADISTVNTLPLMDAPVDTEEGVTYTTINLIIGAALIVLVIFAGVIFRRPKS